jgi:hypothetical protein
MLSHFRPSPAMVVALAALVVALGGTAFAVTNFVGANGQIHGCVSKTGKLVLLKPGAKCQKGSPIAWNQKGAKGTRGPRGLQGLQGPGATSDTTTLPADSATHTLATAGGLNITGTCSGSTASVGLASSNGSSGTQFSGTLSSGSTVGPVDEDQGLPGFETVLAPQVDIDGVGRRSDVVTFTHFDVHGFGASCRFWWMIIPSG